MAAIAEQWFVWLVLVAGFTYLITESAIFAVVRVFLAQGSGLRTMLLYCRACTGAWVGLTVTPEFPLHHRAHGWILSTLAAMLFGYVWTAILGSSQAWESERDLLRLATDDGDDDDDEAY